MNLSVGRGRCRESNKGDRAYTLHGNKGKSTAEFNKENPIYVLNKLSKIQ